MSFLSCASANGTSMPSVRSSSREEIEERMNQNSNPTERAHKDETKLGSMGIYRHLIRPSSHQILISRLKYNKRKYILDKNVVKINVILDIWNSNVQFITLPYFYLFILFHFLMLQGNQNRSKCYIITIWKKQFQIRNNTFPFQPHPCPLNLPSPLLVLTPLGAIHF